MKRRWGKVLILGSFVAPAALVLALIAVGTVPGCTRKATDAEVEEEVVEAGDEGEVSADSESGDSDELADVAEDKQEKPVKKPAEKANDKSQSKPASKAEPKAPAKKKTESKAAQKSVPNSGSSAKAEAKPKASPQRQVASAAGGVYVVQIGAFKVKENAERLQLKLKEAGYPVQLQSLEHSKNGLLHLVRFSPTKDRIEAESAVRDLMSQQSVSAQVLKLPAEE